MTNLEPAESVLAGNFILEDSIIIADATTFLIRWVINIH